MTFPRGLSPIGRRHWPAVKTALGICTLAGGLAGIVRPFPAWGIGALALGVGLEVLVSRRMRNAERAFARTIWFYNRDLPR